MTKPGPVTARLSLRAKNAPPKTQAIPVPDVLLPEGIGDALVAVNTITRADSAGISLIFPDKAVTLVRR
jgi:hypothetical protein